MADPIFIIDGDNVTHARGPGSDYERARAQLIADVASWASRSGVDAVVVLDGHGGDRRIGRTAVPHSRPDAADTLVPRAAHPDARRRSATATRSATRSTRTCGRRSCGCAAASDRPSLPVVPGARAALAKFVLDTAGSRGIVPSLKLYLTVTVSRVEAFSPPKIAI